MRVFTSGKVFMSTAVLATKPTSTLGVAPAPFNEKSFIEKHARSVKTDVERAARKLRCGHPYSILVTPERVAWRCPEAAQTRADLSSTGCEELRALRRLFRKEALAHDLGFNFDTELHHNANCGDHLEDVLMLRVFFTCH